MEDVIVLFHRHVSGPVWLRFLFPPAILLLCTILPAQNLEVIGKARISGRDTVSDRDYMAVFEEDGTLAEMKVNDAIRRYFLNLPNGVQTLLDAGETPLRLFQDGVSTQSLYGKTYAGGIIFFLDTLDVYPFEGLTAATEDQKYDSDAFMQWGCFGTDLPNVPNVPITPDGPGAGIGDGTTNTDSIVVNGCINASNAAYVCYYLELNGYDDWFLPSTDELHTMYTNLAVHGYGDLQSGPYWSSSEYGENHAFSVNLGSNATIANFKNSGFRVRAIRQFGQ